MNISDLIEAEHLNRRAAIYIRQSTGHQVMAHQESTQLQYALKKRATDLGWCDNDIQVIDTDLGQTAATMENREGFKKLVAQITLNEIGVVIAYDATRLARNCSHWYQLLDLCGLANCLIADRDGVYDPSSINGRLLLGLKGQISELELHTIRSRLTAGINNKANRGDLKLHLPTGLLRDALGDVVKHPDALVQERLSMVFDVMLSKRTLNQVVVYFRENGLKLPRTDSSGDVRWVRVTVNAVAKILHNPAYAGAFAYGRSRYTKSKTTGKPTQIRLPRDQWRVLIKDKYPAYIEWETYETIQSMLSDNYSEYGFRKSRGAPRDGHALLHGLVYCAKCGYKMRVRYEHETGWYICNQLKHEYGEGVCQSMQHNAIDEQVVSWFFNAISEAEIDLASETLSAADREQAALDRTISKDIERLRYQSRLVERQYQNTDPENRLVAAELERRWEAALQELKEAEDRYQSKRNGTQSLALPADLIEGLKDLGNSLPDIWNQGMLKPAQQKSLLRCLIEKIVLERDDHDQVLIRVVWKGGAITTGSVTVRVNSFSQRRDAPEIESLIRQLATEGRTDSEIADELTARRFRSPLSDVFLTTTVGNIRRRMRLLSRPGRNNAEYTSGRLTIAQVSAKTGIPVRWIYSQIYQKRLSIEKDRLTNCYLFPDTDETLAKMRSLRNGDVKQLNF